MGERERGREGEREREGLETEKESHDDGERARECRAEQHN